MGDEVLYIDADEEITAVIDRVKESPAGSIVLVIPKGAALLQSIVNLKLLKKEADNLGKDIAFVTTDPVGRNLAGHVGIPVYEEAEKKDLVVRPPSPLRPPPEEEIEIDLSAEGEVPRDVEVYHYLAGKGRPAPEEIGAPGRTNTLKKYMIGGLLIFFAAASTLTFLFPKTTAVIRVKSEPFEVSLDLVIDKKVTDLSRNSSLLPGTEISVIKEKTVTAQATGKKTIGTKAAGTVTVFNNCYDTTSSVTILSGTSVKSSPGNLEFITTTPVTLAAAAVVAGSCSPSSQEVTVEAKSTGDAYNLTPNTNFCVGSYSCTGLTTIFARNRAAFSGGSSRTIAVLKQEDIEAASESAKNELLAVSATDIQKQAEQKSLRILESAIEAQITEKTSDKEPGTETNDAQVTTKIRARTLGFKETDYRQLVFDLLSLRLPEGKRPLLSAEDKITTKVEEADWETGYIKLRGDVQTRIADKLDEDSLKRTLRNKSLGEAHKELMKLPGVIEVSINSIPSFINRTALFVHNISVKEEAQ